MQENNNIPKTKEEAFANGKAAPTEGWNPYRNRGQEYAELHSAWVDGFESRNK